MATGKLPNDLLEEIVLKYISHKNEDIITGGAVGLDNALVDFGDQVAVLSTDPITGAVQDIGKLAVHVACNDVATSGGQALGLLLTILLPVNTSYSDIENIMQDASQTADNLGVEIIGGHTEVTDAVNKVVISTTVIGKMAKKDLQDISKIKVGDKLVMSKTSGLEGTAILLTDFADYFADKMTRDDIQLGQSYVDYLSVLPEGRIGGHASLNYMHDITEGGVLGAVWEAQQALDKGVRIYQDQIPLTDITRQLCDLLEINPFRLISSGSMLMVANDDQLKILQKEYQAQNIPLAVIGELTESGAEIISHGQSNQIDPPTADHLYLAIDYLKGRC